MKKAVMLVVFVVLCSSFAVADDCGIYCWLMKFRYGGKALVGEAGYPICSDFYRERTHMEICQQDNKFYIYDETGFEGRGEHYPVTGIESDGKPIVKWDSPGIGRDPDAMNPDLYESSEFQIERLSGQSEPVQQEEEAAASQPVCDPNQESCPDAPVSEGGGVEPQPGAEPAPAAKDKPTPKGRVYIPKDTGPLPEGMNEPNTPAIIDEKGNVWRDDGEGGYYYLDKNKKKYTATLEETRVGGKKLRFQGEDGFYYKLDAREETMVYTAEGDIYDYTYRNGNWYVYSKNSDRQVRIRNEDAVAELDRRHVTQDQEERVGIAGFLTSVALTLLGDTGKDIESPGASSDEQKGSKGTPQAVPVITPSITLSEAKLATSDDYNKALKSERGVLVGFYDLHGDGSRVLEGQFKQDSSGREVFVPFNSDFVFELDEEAKKARTRVALVYDSRRVQSSGSDIEVRADGKGGFTAVVKPKTELPGMEAPAGANVVTLDNVVPNKPKIGLGNALVRNYDLTAQQQTQLSSQEGLQSSYKATPSDEAQRGRFFYVGETDQTYFVSEDDYNKWASKKPVDRDFTDLIQESGAKVTQSGRLLSQQVELAEPMRKSLPIPEAQDYSADDGSIDRSLDVARLEREDFMELGPTEKLNAISQATDEEREKLLSYLDENERRQMLIDLARTRDQSRQRAIVAAEGREAERWDGDRDIEGLPGDGQLSLEDGNLVLDCGTICRDRPMRVNKETGKIEGWTGKWEEVPDDVLARIPDVQEKTDLLDKRDTVMMDLQSKAQRQREAESTHAGELQRAEAGRARVAAEEFSDVPKAQLAEALAKAPQDTEFKPKKVVDGDGREWVLQPDGSYLNDNDPRYPGSSRRALLSDDKKELVPHGGTGQLTGYTQGAHSNAPIIDVKSYELSRERGYIPEGETTTVSDHGARQSTAGYISNAFAKKELPPVESQNPLQPPKSLPYQVEVDGKRATLKWLGREEDKTKGKGWGYVSTKGVEIQLEKGSKVTSVGETNVKEGVPRVIDASGAILVGYQPTEKRDKGHVHFDVPGQDFVEEGRGGDTRVVFDKAGNAIGMYVGDNFESMEKMSLQDRQFAKSLESKYQRQRSELLKQQLSEKYSSEGWSNPTAKSGSTYTLQNEAGDVRIVDVNTEESAIIRRIDGQVVYTKRYDSNGRLIGINKGEGYKKLEDIDYSDNPQLQADIDEIRRVEGVYSDEDYVEITGEGSGRAFTDIFNREESVATAVDMAVEGLEARRGPLAEGKPVAAKPVPAAVASPAGTAASGVSEQPAEEETPSAPTLTRAQRIGQAWLKNPLSKTTHVMSIPNADMAALGLKNGEFYAVNKDGVIYKIGADGPSVVKDSELIAKIKEHDSFDESKEGAVQKEAAAEAAKKQADLTPDEKARQALLQDARNGRKTYGQIYDEMIDKSKALNAEADLLQAGIDKRVDDIMSANRLPQQSLQVEKDGKDLYYSYDKGSKTWKSKTKGAPELDDDAMKAKQAEKYAKVESDKLAAQRAEAKKWEETGEANEWQGQWWNDLSPSADRDSEGKVKDGFLNTAAAIMSGEYTADIGAGLSALSQRFGRYQATSNLLFDNSMFINAANDAFIREWADFTGTITKAACNEDEALRQDTPQGNVRMVKDPTGRLTPVISLQAEKFPLTGASIPIMCKPNPTPEDGEPMICSDNLICKDGIYCYHSESDEQPAKGFFYKVSYGVKVPQDQSYTPYLNESGTALKFNLKLRGDGEKWVYSSQGMRGYILALNNGESDSNTFAAYSIKDYKEVCILFDPLFNMIYGQRLDTNEKGNPEPHCKSFIQNQQSAIDFSKSAQGSSSSGTNIPSQTPSSEGVQMDI